MFEYMTRSVEPINFSATIIVAIIFLFVYAVVRKSEGITVFKSINFWLMMLFFQIGSTQVFLYLMSAYTELTGPDLERRGAYLFIYLWNLTIKVMLGFHFLKFALKVVKNDK